MNLLIGAGNHCNAYKHRGELEREQEVVQEVVQEGVQEVVQEGIQVVQGEQVQRGIIRQVQRGIIRDTIRKQIIRKQAIRRPGVKGIRKQMIPLISHDKFKIS
jgi:hypothetical protein